jgi:transcriptional regulator with XRE-family HTH domain
MLNLGFAKYFFVSYDSKKGGVMAADYIGRRLKYYRQLRGLKAADLAKLSGVPQSTISDLERGIRGGVNLTVRNAERLCWALGISLDTLCRKDRDEETSETEFESAVEDLVPA